MCVVRKVLVKPVLCLLISIGFSDVKSPILLQMFDYSLSTGILSLVTGPLTIFVYLALVFNYIERPFV